MKKAATLKRSENRRVGGLELFCVGFLKHNYKDVAETKSAFERFKKRNMIVG